MAKNEAKVRFSAETKEFDSALQSSKEELASLKAELKLNEAQFKNTGDSAEYYSQKSQLLQAELENNAQKQEALTGKIEVAKAIYGENSAEVQKLETSLTYAKIQEENIKAAIDNCNNSMNEQSNSSKDAGDSLDQMAQIQATQFLQDVADKAMEAAKSMIELANESSEVTDTIDKMSQRLGMSTDAYQTWEYILSQNGSDISQLRAGFRTLTNEIGDVIEKGTTAGTAFESLGISLEDIKGKSQEEVFAQTIYALQDVEDQTQRAALANDILGRSGQELAPLLNQSKESTQALAEKAHELGIVLGEDAVDQGVAFHDSMDTLNRSLGSVKTMIGSAFQPAIEGVINVIQPAIPVIKTVTDKINETVKKSPALQAVIVGITTAFIALAVALSIVTLIKAVNTAMIALKGTMLALPITWIAIAIIGVVSALIYAYKNSETFRNVVQSAFAKVRAVVGTVINVFTKLVAAVKNIPKTVLNMKRNIVAHFANLYHETKAKFEAIKNAIVNPFTRAKEKIGGIIKKIKGFFPISIGKVLSNLKLPSFSLKSSTKQYGKLGAVSYPSRMDVSWHADAMSNPKILNKPTIFGMINGRLQGGGEAGNELVGGASTVMGMIRQAVSESSLGAIIDYDKLADKVGEKLARMKISIKIGEFARMVREVL